MTDDNDSALAELAVWTAVHVERAPGFLEKRLVLVRAFSQAHQLNAAVTDDPDLILLDTLLRHPERLVRNLRDLWTDNDDSRSW
jgi:hypothetical protein